MNTIRRTTPLVLMLCLSVAGCRLPEAGDHVGPIPGVTNASIHVLFDTTSALPVSGTYDWGLSLMRVDPDLNVTLSEVEERLHQSLRSQLPLEGFSYTNAAPDYLVGFALIGGTSLDESELNRAYGRTLSFPARTADAPALNYGAGVLILDLVQRGNGRLLWRGAIKADLDLTLPEAQKQSRCDGAILELLRHYPKPPASR